MVSSKILISTMVLNTDENISFFQRTDPNLLNGSVCLCIYIHYLQGFLYSVCILYIILYIK